jgi:hypothetical protein
VKQEEARVVPRGAHVGVGDTGVVEQCPDGASPHVDPRNERKKSTAAAGANNALSLVLCRPDFN